MTNEQLETLIDTLGKVLFGFLEEGNGPTISALLTGIEKQIKDPAILADKYWKLQVSKFIEHLIQTGTIKRVGKGAKRFYIPGDKYNTK